ncbi:prepilin peptidase [Paucilactobacillus suebicus]|uniref:Bacterial peptidase A24 domain-containing protein n=1 Tax=Paucilactobacillus suebicus DSM 5007 = KCTC 3549 TaxID=1423807 RepID=A0A0R1W776_9LACO|nr:bacterial peptidase A24 domain-containing protein [Paucilactobacillus suebicus DSM 5007 = KCTC 3549]
MSLLYFCIGTILASFTTLCAWRIPQGISIIIPRSSCDSCHHLLKHWQLIPIIGFVIQKGKCHFCKQRISCVSFINELCIGTFCHICSQLPMQLFVGYLLVFLTLIFISTMDLEFGYIYPICLLGLTPCFFLLPLPNYQSYTFWIATIFILLLLLFLSLYCKSLGFADVELIMICQFVWGFYLTNMIILSSSLIATVWMLFFKHHDRIPFLPFLCSATMLVILWQMNMY